MRWTVAWIVLVALAAALSSAQAETLAQPASAPETASAGVPTAVVNLGNITDPDQRRAVCGYLTAESERLSYEFKQPLPPPVIDSIATDLSQLRQQINHYSCAPPDSAQGLTRIPVRRHIEPSTD